MKLNTIMTYEQVAVINRFNTIENPDGGDPRREYYPDGDINIKFIARTGRNPVVYTEENLELFEILSDVRDAGGITIGEESWRVVGKSPVLDAFGYMTGNAYSVTLVPKED